MVSISMRALAIVSLLGLLNTPEMAEPLPATPYLPGDLVYAQSDTANYTPYDDEIMDWSCSDWDCQMGGGYYCETLFLCGLGCPAKWYTGSATRTCTPTNGPPIIETRPCNQYGGCCGDSGAQCPTLQLDELYQEED